MKNILAAASLGGHWIQLLRITAPMEKTCRVSYMSTHPKCQSMVEGHPFYLLHDFSRWDAWRLLPAMATAIKVLRHEKPDAVISTGAAPGLMVVLAARILGIRSIWIDSFANAGQLSMCGRIASRLATATFTQWPHLANNKVQYAGNILGKDTEEQ